MLSSAGVLYWITYRQIRQQHLDQALVVAVKKSNTPAILSLLADGANPNAQETSNTHLTFWSIIVNAFQGKKGAGSQAPSCLLLCTGNYEGQLGDFGESLNYPPENAVAVKALLKYGADVNATNTHGISSLMSACKLGYRNTVALLLQSGADLRQRSRSGNSVIEYATSDPATIDASIVKMLAVAGADINVTDGEGRTALMRSVIIMDVPTINVLLDEKANIQTKDNSGLTALDYATRTGILSSSELYKRLSGAHSKN